jgi:hypothetical protein
MMDNGIDNDNTTVYDNFLYIIDTAIESGNASIIQQAIKDYKNIPEVYINMAKTIYLQLITEQIEGMSLTN